MSKSSYRRSLELQLAEIGKSLALAKARLQCARTEARSQRAAEAIALEQRYRDIGARLLSLKDAPDGVGADVSAEFQRMVDGVTDSLGSWIKTTDWGYRRRH